MSRDRDSFDRLVRWYPRWWRDANAAAFVGTAMDAAEAAGLRTPSRGERVAAALRRGGPPRAPDVPGFPRVKGASLARGILEIGPLMTPFDPPFGPCLKPF